MKHALLSLCATCSVLIWSPLQAQGLYGSTVTATAYYPDLASQVTIPNVKLVGAAVEYPQGSLLLLGGQPIVAPTVMDIGPTSIDFTWNGSVSSGNGSFDGIVFQFAGAPTITGVSLNPATNVPAGWAQVSYSANQVLVNLVGGHTFTSTSHVLVDVSLVPEPSQMALLAAGLLVVLGASRRARPQRR